MLLFIQRETEVICSEVPVSIHLMLLFIEVSGVGSAVVEAFQYISCYSLSNCKEYRLYKQKGFNTSHVTLYRKPGTAKLPAESSFNTSHVTLYHIRLVRKASADRVSIHLMLLFIGFSSNHRYSGCQFQYISCYSLSALRVLSMYQKLSFNTSHVTLYPSFYRLFFF